MDHIYFKAKGYDDSFFTEMDIIRAAMITEGIFIDYRNEGQIREFAWKCKGVGEEIKRPSVRYLVNKGNKIGAIHVFRDIHNCSIVEAKEAVDKMMAENERRKHNDKTNIRNA